MSQNQAVASSCLSKNQSDDAIYTCRDLSQASFERSESTESASSSYPASDLHDKIDERILKAQRKRREQLENYYAAELQSKENQNEKEPTSPSSVGGTSSAGAFLSNQRKKFAAAMTSTKDGGGKKKIAREREFFKNSKGNNVHFPPDVLIIEATMRGDIDEVEELLKLGANPNSVNADGLTCLHQCSIDNSTEIADVLINSGGDVNHTDHELWTPLHAAATCGHAEMVTKLIDRGADLLPVNSDGDLPSDICDDQMCLKILEREIKKRCITQKEIEKKRSMREECMLNDIKAFINSKDGSITQLQKWKENQGGTLLHIAAANGYLNVSKYLLDRGFSCDILDNDGYAPVHAAVAWGELEAFELLLSHGANASLKTNEGFHLLDFCETDELRDKVVAILKKYSSKSKDFDDRRGTVRSGGSVSCRNRSDFLRKMSLDRDFVGKVEKKMDAELAMVPSELEDYDPNASLQRQSLSPTPVSSPVKSFLSSISDAVDKHMHNRNGKEHESDVVFNTNKEANNLKFSTNGDDVNINAVVPAISFSKDNSGKRSPLVKLTGITKKDSSDDKQQQQPRPTSTKPGKYDPTTASTLSDLKKQRNKNRRESASSATAGESFGSLTSHGNMRHSASPRRKSNETSAFSLLASSTLHVPVNAVVGIAASNTSVSSRKKGKHADCSSDGGGSSGRRKGKNSNSCSSGQEFVLKKFTSPTDSVVGAHPDVLSDASTRKRKTCCSLM